MLSFFWLLSFNGKSKQRNSGLEEQNVPFSSILQVLTKANTGYDSTGLCPTLPMKKPDNEWTT